MKLEDRILVDLESPEVMDTIVEGTKDLFGNLNGSLTYDGDVVYRNVNVEIVLDTWFLFYIRGAQHGSMLFRDCPTSLARMVRASAHRYPTDNSPITVDYGSRSQVELVFENLPNAAAVKHFITYVKYMKKLGTRKFYPQCLDLVSGLEKPRVTKNIINTKPVIDELHDKLLKGISAGAYKAFGLTPAKSYTDWHRRENAWHALYEIAWYVEDHISRRDKKNNID